VYLSEVGIRLFGTIIKHLKRFSVSAAGGLQVISDFNAYYSWVSSLNMSSSDTLQLFAVLKELGNMYIVDAAGLKQIIHDQQSQRFRDALKTEDLLELVALRTDWKQIKNKVEVSDCVVQ
jgi:recyclin-1